MCLVTYWIFLATQRDQRQNEDLRQNTVDFKREICQMLIDFPQPPCKICQGRPCDGHQINLRVLRGGGWGGSGVGWGWAMGCTRGRPRCALGES